MPPTRPPRRVSTEKSNQWPKKTAPCRSVAINDDMRRLATGDILLTLSPTGAISHDPGGLASRPVSWKDSGDQIS